MNVTINKFVVYRILSNGVCAHNLKNNIQIIISSVGADIWTYISNHHQPLDINNIVNFIKSEYSNNDSNVVKKDLIKFLHSLYSKKFISLDQVESSEINNDSNNSVPEESIGFSALLSENNLNAVTFEMTYKCNEKCIHCYAVNNDTCENIQELKYDEYIKLIDDLYDMNCMYLSFTGGDPFVRKDFLDIYKYAINKKFAVDIYTNALLINDKVFDTFNDYYPKGFYISLYSLDSKIHDSITRINGSHEKTLKAIKRLKDGGFRVTLNIPLMKQNLSGMTDLLKYAKSNEINYKLSFGMTPKNDGDKSPLEFQVKDKNTIIEILKIDHELRGAPKIEKVHENDTICGAGINFLSVSPYGIVNPCVGMVYNVGSVREQSISNIWLKSKKLDHIKKLKWKDAKDCHSCDTIDHCNHCLALSLSETGNELSKNTIDCFLSQCKRDFYKGGDYNAEKI